MKIAHGICGGRQMLSSRLLKKGLPISRALILWGLGMAGAMRATTRFAAVFQLCRPGEAGSVGHPLRVIREVANAALKLLGGEFVALYSPIGGGSIPPERLMRALLVLQAFIRSGRSGNWSSGSNTISCSAGLSGS